MSNRILESKTSRVSYNCSHCGETTKKPICDESEFFCCHGCHTVYHALKEKNLLHYYKLRESVGANAGSTPSIASDDDFSYMSQDKFQAEFLSPNENGLNIKLYLEGIHCVACIWLLEKIPHFIEQVRMARVDLGKSTIELTVSPGADLAHIAREIAKMGYRPHPIKSNDEIELLKQREDRLKLIQIGVAGACSANIMLYSISIYAGAGAAFSALFGWVSFFLTLPVLFFSAIPFYKNSISALRNKSINIDIPISIAIILGGATGFYNLFNGSNHFYFDSIAILVFLLLTSRYLVHKSLQSGLNSKGLKSLFEQSGILKLNVETNAFESIHSSHLQVGDILKIPTGKPFPNDSIVVEGESFVNNSLISGESKPIKVSCGDTIFAGAQNISETLMVKVTHLFSDSTLGKIITKVESSSSEKLYLHSLTDKLSKWFVATLFSLATICFLYFLNTGGIEIAIERTLSLIIISCPCALGLAAPLALARAMNLASKQGIIIKNELSIEELANIKSVYFDKTGTLTKGNFSVSKIQSDIDLDQYRDIIYSLESESTHPIASAIISWTNSTNLIPMTCYLEVAGSGVSAKLKNNSYSLTKAVASKSNLGFSVVEFKENDKSLAHFYLSDEIQPNSQTLIDKIKKSKKKIYILSGDHSTNVEELAKKLSLEPKHCLGDQTPESKARIITKDQNTLMIGDGANDAIAMKEASVSVSVRGAMGISLRASDIYLTKSPMESLSNLFTLANRTYFTIKLNLFLSLAYNVLGVSLALSGLISPLVAAILMPISSATVIIATLLNLKGSQK